MFFLETETSALSQYSPILILVLMFVVMYFLLIRPQKKKEKKAEEMRSNVQVGDEVITIGGIIGRVVIVKDDYLVIETGSDRSKVRIKKWSIQSNESLEDAVSASSVKEDKIEDKDIKDK